MNLGEIVLKMRKIILLTIHLSQLLNLLNGMRQKKLVFSIYRRYSMTARLKVLMIANIRYEGQELEIT